MPRDNNKQVEKLWNKEIPTRDASNYTEGRKSTRHFEARKSKFLKCEKTSTFSCKISKISFDRLFGP